MEGMRDAAVWKWWIKIYAVQLYMSYEYIYTTYICTVSKCHHQFILISLPRNERREWMTSVRGCYSRTPNFSLPFSPIPTQSWSRIAEADADADAHDSFFSATSFFLSTLFYSLFCLHISVLNWHHIPPPSNHFLPIFINFTKFRHFSVHQFPYTYEIEDLDEYCGGCMSELIRKTSSRRHQLMLDKLFAHEQIIIAQRHSNIQYPIYIVN